MTKANITILARKQRLLTGKSVPHYAGETINLIEVHFDLDESWEGFDSIRAVWWNNAEKATVLDANMDCTIPLEVVAKKGDVMVNLIASIAENGVLTDRYTSYPFKAAVIDADVKLTGTETVPVTPSQFEQFVENVKDDADRAEDAKDSARVYAGNALSSAQNASASEVNAKTSEDNAKISENNASASATEAEEWADKAEQSAEDAGFMEFHIDDNGHLIYERTSNVDQIDFELVN